MKRLQLFLTLYSKLHYLINAIYQSLHTAKINCTVSIFVQRPANTSFTHVLTLAVNDTTLLIDACPPKQHSPTTFFAF